MPFYTHNLRLRLNLLIRGNIKGPNASAIRRFHCIHILDVPVYNYVHVACLPPSQLPVLFGGHHSYDLYSPNVKLENNLSAFSWTTHGRRSYECFVRCSLWSVYCCYRQPQLELLKITKQLGSGTVEARWRITGIPRARIRSKRR